MKEAATIVRAEDVYAVYFHGPAYQVVGSAWRYDGGSVAVLARDLPPNHGQTDRPTVTGPRLVELCFQTAGLWQIGREGRLALPHHVDRVTIVRDPRAVSGELYALAHPHDGAFDCVVVDEGGGVVVRVEGYRTVPLPNPVGDALRTPIAAAMAD